MNKPIPVFCSCGKAVPAYFYCDGCRKVHGNPNCPCGKPMKGLRVPACEDCAPQVPNFRDQLRSLYYRKTGFCPAGDCAIPECPTCKKSDSPIVRCDVCVKDECSLCARACQKTAQIATNISTDTKRKTDGVVTYSGTGKRYKKGADKDRPAMFVEAWEYKGPKLIKRTLVGFQKKEA